MIKIIFGKYTPPYFTGGIQTYIFFFSKFLNKRNIEHEIISIKDGALYNNPGNIHKISVTKLPILGPIIFQLKLNKILNSKDLINIHYPTIGAFLRSDLKVIQTVHTLSSEEGRYLFGTKRKFYSILRRLIRATYNKRLEKKSFKKAHHIICLNNDLYEKILKYGINPRKVTIIPNGVDIDYFKYEKLNKISRNKPIKLLYAGRLAPRKNILRLLESLKEFSNNDYVLNIVGKGNQEIVLKEFVKQNALESKVNFLGYKSGEELLLAYKNCDVFVLPSFYEGLPFTVLEAMAIGRACMVGNFSNADMMINNNENGFIVNENTKEDFILTLKKILNAKEVLNKYGEKAFKKVKEEYSIENTYNKVLKIFKL